MNWKAVYQTVNPPPVQLIAAISLPLRQKPDSSYLRKLSNLRKKSSCSGIQGFCRTAVSSPSMILKESH